MIKIPSGLFTREGVACYKIYLSEYYIDKYEIINRQFKKFYDATGRNYPPDPKFLGDSDYFINKPNYPVVMVSWKNANAYCRWAGKKFPTEAEREKAAQGIDARSYPWGNVKIDGNSRMNNEAILRIRTLNM